MPSLRSVSCSKSSSVPGTKGRRPGAWGRGAGLVCTGKASACPSGRRALFLQEGSAASPVPCRGAASAGRRPAALLPGSSARDLGLCCRAGPGSVGRAVGCGTTSGWPGFCDSDARGIPPRCSRGRDALCACGSHPRGRHRRGPSRFPCPPLFRGHCLSRLEEWRLPRAAGAAWTPRTGCLQTGRQHLPGQFYLVPPLKEEIRQGFQSRGYSPQDHCPASFSPYILGSSDTLLGLSVSLADPCSSPGSYPAPHRARETSAPPSTLR